MRIDKPIVIALTLFIILLLIFFLVSPEYQRFKTLQSELGIKKAEYNAEFEYYSAISKTYNDLVARKDDVVKIDDALPSDPNLGKLVYFVQENAIQSGLVLKSLFLTKSTSASEDTVRDITFSLSLIGNYSALENFIASLEQSSRLFEIVNISFGSGDVSNSQAQFQSESLFTFSMQVNTHAY